MSDRRENSRFKTFGKLSTAFGEVMDISDSGLGVFRKGRMPLSLGEEVSVHLSHEGIEVELTARVARIDPVGLFRHEIGLEFVDANEDKLTKIWAMADSACNEFSSPRCWIAA